MRWNTILDVDPALPPGTAELRTERNLVRICNVDVPPAAKAPAPEKHDCPHFNVDYPRFRYEPEAPFTAPPPIRTTIVASPDDCPHCLRERIKKLCGGLQNALGVLSYIAPDDRPAGSYEQIKRATEALYNDRKHFRP